MLRLGRAGLSRPITIAWRPRALSTVTESAFGGADACGPPLTIIGGFLGSGKTSTLKHLLANRAGLRIGLVVNDVAEVNVDAATLRRSDLGNVALAELQNGCVCCGPDAENLAPTIDALQRRTDPATGAAALDHVVVELSGVADPTAVQARLLGSGLLVDRTVALVDAHAFPALFAATAPLRERLELLEAGEAECEVDEQVAALVQSGLYPV